MRLVNTPTTTPSRRFQSTHPLRGATLRPKRKLIAEGISIHAPLAGCDNLLSNHRARGGISIHAPLAGCDKGRATQGGQILDFNPRTPCGVRLYRHIFYNFCLSFQSTHPLRGATVKQKIIFFKIRISIHAPLAGCDYLRLLLLFRSYDFNPRTPCGVRREHIIYHAHAERFQSTHPLRGATPFTANAQTSSSFQSTHPLRGATRLRRFNVHLREISIHAPLAGCDGDV